MAKRQFIPCPELMSILETDFEPIDSVERIASETNPNRDRFAASRIADALVRAREPGGGNRPIRRAGGRAFGVGHSVRGQLAFGAVSVHFSTPRGIRCQGHSVSVHFSTPRAFGVGYSVSVHFSTPQKN
jgi:hypothetical protein